MEFGITVSFGSIYEDWDYFSFADFRCYKGLWRNREVIENLMIGRRTVGSSGVVQKKRPNERAPLEYIAERMGVQGESFQ